MQRHQQHRAQTDMPRDDGYTQAPDIQGREREGLNSCHSLEPETLTSRSLSTQRLNRHWL